MQQHQRHDSATAADSSGVSVEHMHHQHCQQQQSGSARAGRAPLHTLRLFGALLPPVRQQHSITSNCSSGCTAVNTCSRQQPHHGRHCRWCPGAASSGLHVCCNGLFPVLAMPGVAWLHQLAIPTAVQLCYLHVLQSPVVSLSLTMVAVHYSSASFTASAHLLRVWRPHVRLAIALSRLQPKRGSRQLRADAVHPCRPHCAC